MISLHGSAPPRLCRGLTRNPETTGKQLGWERGRIREHFPCTLYLRTYSISFAQLLYIQGHIQAAKRLMSLEKEVLSLFQCKERKKVDI